MSSTAADQLSFGGPEFTPVSPLRRQYLDLKRRNPDALLLFRLGDFYEMFDDDARIASATLDLVLTGREVGRGERVPMAGLPYHAAEGYIARLLSAGHRVAMCEQVGESAIKGLMERQVVRVLSPGTLLEDHLLPTQSHNYLVAIAPEIDGAGLAAVDVSTGSLLCTVARGDGWQEKLSAELAGLAPAECVATDATAVTLEQIVPPGCRITTRPDTEASDRNVSARLRDHFRVPTLEPLGLQSEPLAARALSLALGYVAETVPGALALLDRVTVYALEGVMLLDPATRRNLELTAGLRSGAKDGSVLGALDATTTAMGGRCLRRWITQPLLSLEAINQRLDAVEELTVQDRARLRLRELLASMPDLERLSARLAQGSVGPRALLSLASGLTALDPIRSELALLSQQSTRAGALEGFADVTERILVQIADEPPAQLGPGTIRPGFSAQLDELRALVGDTRSWIAALERQERERSGVKALKVGYNRVFGYYLEASLSVLGQTTDYYQREQTGANTIGEHLVGLGYVRKQTLSNAERYITAQLEEYERKASSAQDEIERLERRLFSTLVAELSSHARRIADAGAALGTVDALASFAEVAIRHRYVRPLLALEPVLELEEARHPVVERSLGLGEYVPNDVHLGGESGPVALVTGPNMAGKSTFLRQVAIAVLLAQVGSFVPARRATIGITDRVFTRIGAQDDLAGRQSTFMVEMVETAQILRNATRHSLVILDEVGRGTSTHDGLAVAQAVLEHVHDAPQLGCRTLFATHYHELADLAERLPGLQPLRLEVLEREDEVIFLHRVVPGGADKSYGVYVARLAGVPASVANRAQQILIELETGTQRRAGSAPVPSQPTPRDALRKRLDTLDPLNMTPVQALEELMRLQILARETPA